ncbi:arylamine N-acetyltransferase family protein [Rhodococcus rhodnii]|uniref:arylamine N-acetyltransferase family protein n=1 Tax=Rhodococcus rhodnii TaxID=38312 RepID=UPI001EE6CCAF|nr:arylamine N-acetyltransferase [Rhodococcus rhodnii]
MSEIDLRSYLTRVGFPENEDPAADVATLDRLIALHADAIAFENLDPFLGVPNRIDLDAIVAKLVDGRRGGYCFEQNLLFAAVLERIGFTVTRLAARVLWGGASPDDPGARTHMLLAVDVAGQRRIADVGFGGMTPTASLPLTIGAVGATPLEPFRFTAGQGATYVLDALTGDAWRPVYMFDEQAHLPVDYEPINWYLSTWPQSRFVTTLTAARPTPTHRYALAGRRFTIHRPGRPLERRELASAHELRDVLEESFGIDTRALDLDAAFARA